MANRIHYAVSVTPIYTFGSTETEGVAMDTLASDYAKSFSGSANTTGVVYGLIGAAAKNNITVTTGTALATTSSSKGLFLRHTGYDSNGDATSATLTVLRTASALVVLEPGGAIYFPNPSNAAFTGTASAGDIVVEMAHFT